MKPVLQDERGMALAVAIVALVIVGALVAGALFSGTQEQRMAESTRFQLQSFGVAEAGVYEGMGQWTQNRVTYNARRAYPLDSGVAINAGAWTPAPSNTGSFAGTVFKVNDNQYLMDVTGRDTMSRANRLRGGGFGQRLGVLTRIAPLQADIQAAMTTGGPVTWGGGNTFVKGADTPPTGWAGCGAAGPSLAGARAKSIGDLGSSNGQYTGTPDSIISPSMDTSTFYNYGYTNYSTLTQQASIQLNPGTYAPAPTTVSGACQTTNQLNWGDGVTPTNPCGTYYPIVWLKGANQSWTISGGQGQGVLLVDGNLSLQGTFKYFGLIVVRGVTTTAANASISISGALLSQGMNLGANSSGTGAFTVGYSSCAITRAFQGTGVAAMNRSRGWVPLY